MTQHIRTFLLFICAIQLLFAIAFFFQLPTIVNQWPFPGTTPLTYIFIASIFAAAAAAKAWAAGSKNYGALAGIGLDYAVILAPVAILSLQLGAANGNPQLIGYGIACIFGALFGIWLLLWSIRILLDTSIPTPRLVRWSFMADAPGLVS
jgi:hypothetical protein